MPEVTIDKNSSDREIANWIGKYIAECTREGERPRDQCIAIAHEMARKATGKSIQRGKS